MPFCAFGAKRHWAGKNEAVKMPAERKRANKSADQELRRPENKASYSKKRKANSSSNIPGSKKGVKKPKIEDSTSTKMGEENHVVPIDSFLPDRDRVGCNVFCDSDGPWDVLLHKTNARSNNNNKYVLLQLIENTKSGFFYIWSRCGEIGDRENHHKILSYFSTIHSAKKNFEKQFQEKTKNLWPCSFENFVKHTGKYYLKKRDCSTSEVKEDRAIV